MATKRPTTRPSEPIRTPASPQRQRVLLVTGTGKRRLSWREKV